MHEVTGGVGDSEGIAHRYALREIELAAQDDFIFDAIGPHHEPGTRFPAHRTAVSGSGHEERVEQDIIRRGTALGAVHSCADEGQAVGALFEEADLSENDAAAIEQAAPWLQMKRNIPLAQGTAGRSKPGYLTRKKLV